MSLIISMTCHLYGVEDQFRDPLTLDVDQMRLEQGFRRLEPLAAHFDHSSIWKL